MKNILESVLVWMVCLGAILGCKTKADEVGQEITHKDSSVDADVVNVLDKVAQTEKTTNGSWCEKFTAGARVQAQVMRTKFSPDISDEELESLVSEKTKLCMEQSEAVQKCLLVSEREKPACKVDLADLSITPTEQGQGATPLEQWLCPGLNIEPGRRIGPLALGMRVSEQLPKLKAELDRKYPNTWTSDTHPLRYERSAQGPFVAVGDIYHLTTESDGKLQRIDLNLAALPDGCAKIRGKPLPKQASLEEIAKLFTKCGKLSVNEGGNVIQCEGGKVTLANNLAVDKAVHVRTQASPQG